MSGDVELAVVDEAEEEAREAMEAAEGGRGAETGMELEGWDAEDDERRERILSVLNDMTGWWAGGDSHVNAVGGADAG